MRGLVNSSKVRVRGVPAWFIRFSSADAGGVLTTVCRNRTRGFKAAAARDGGHGQNAVCSVLLVIVGSLTGR